MLDGVASEESSISEPERNFVISAIGRAKGWLKRKRHRRIENEEGVSIGQDGESRSPKLVSYRTVDLLMAAQGLRVPLPALVKALARSTISDGTGCDVSPDDDEVLKLNIATQRQQDYSEDFSDKSPCSSPQNGFGIVLNTAPRARTSNRHSIGASNGFNRWQSTLKESPGQERDSGNVMLVHMNPTPFDSLPPQLAAYMIIPPDDEDRQPGRATSQKLIFAIPNLPDDVLEPQKHPLLSLCGVSVPSEVETVTIFQNQEPDESDIFSDVYISVFLTSPPWAWVVLSLAVISSSFVHPVVAKLHKYANNDSLVGVWWATGEALGFIVLIIFTLATHKWTRSERLFFAGSGTPWGILQLSLMGLLSGAEGASWVGAFTGKGLTVQRFVLHALTPLLILLWRLLRRQRVYLGEFFGVFIVLGGIGMFAYPGSGTHSWDGKDSFALLSSVCMSGYLLCAKNVTSQLPVAAVLFPVSLVAVLPTLITSAIVGMDMSTSDHGLFGFAGSKHSLLWWLALIGLSCCKQVFYMHSLRYLHPVVSASAKCVDAVIATYLSRYLFSVDADTPLHLKWAIPGSLLVLIGAIVACFVSVRKRSVVELEVSKLKRRRHERHILTASNLKKSQIPYTEHLYSTECNS
eukprot:TRINITY_DN1914_c0_g1_i1.p1 TRINITY_DN1914_c0_g1~~TRINITY_DN1914_c0_g1_i1.p1  ORF type:complete len:634 (+),score=85.26 TRINITY_DN1914_c0_g1_i1:37-1938(+)